VIATAALQGHWRRNWLRAPGFLDNTTRVHWVQADNWCADIRVPLVRPDIAAAGSLSALPGRDLAVLLTAEGFAGQTSLAGNVCTWARTWNWRGFPCPVDAGALSFDEAGQMIEDGVHADYREAWVRVPGATWHAEAIEADDADGMLISNDTSFVLTLGQRGAEAWHLPANAFGESSISPQDAAPAFASVYVMGHWDKGLGIADLSTQPFCEGTAVLTRATATAALTLPDFHGAAVTRSLRISPLFSN